MADKTISQLVPASQVKASDLFLLEQDGTAKKLTGQTLENWLLSFADGHGGIQSIEKVGTTVLEDTYRITLSDETTYSFSITNGKSITGVTEYFAVSTSGTTVPSSWSTSRPTLTATNRYLWHYFRISYNDGTNTDTTKAVTGVYGDTGPQSYVHFKWSSVASPSASDMGNIPAEYIGIYSGTSASAPTAPSSYKWYRYKGDKGNPGADSAIVSSSVSYKTSTSGTSVPTGQWTSTVPAVAPGSFLWTRIVITFNTGEPITSYSVARWGIDGAGSVASVNGVSPDAGGNVTLAAGSIRMEDGTTVEDAINSSGDVRSVAGVRPDASGNVSLTARSIGAAASVNNVSPAANGNVTLNADNIMAGSKSVGAYLDEINAAGYVESRISDEGITAPMIKPGSVSDLYTGTLGTSWTGSSAPYTQTVTVQGVSADDTPVIDMVPDSTYATATAQEAAWANVYRAITGENTITFYAKTKTTTEVPFQARCIRK